MNSLSRWDPSPGIDAAIAGKRAQDCFDLAPGFAHLNHGSYGAVPIAVRCEQARLRDLIERNPTGFFQDELPPLMRRAAGHVARRLGGAGDDWVFCENATAAVSGILASLALAPGDEILTTSHAYGAVAKSMRLWAARRGAILTVAQLPDFLDHDDQVVDSLAAAITPFTRLIVVDHITSASAAILPVRRIADLSRAAGIPLLVDGAHAPGHIELDVPALGADWYVGNAHKWLFAPRGCGVLWTAPKRQSQTLPAVLSHGAPDDYTAAFDWVGTRDVTPWLCFEAGALAHEQFGGASLMARNRDLAKQGAAMLCAEIEATPAAPEKMRGAMAMLAMPVSCDDPMRAAQFRQALMRQHRVVVPVYPFGGKLCFRLSAQIYNTPTDYECCARAIRAVIADSVPRMPETSCHFE
jgi:isopenicillin-N epimerase